MITAHLSNLTLDLPLSFEWELIRESQLLSFDKLVDCAIPKITFSDSEHNRAVLNHPTRFTLVRKTVRRYNGFELRSNGSVLIRGTLILTDGFTGSVYGTAGKLAELNSDKKITDYSLPENIVFENKLEYTVEDGYAPAHVQNPAFFSGVSKAITEGEDEGLTILQRHHKNLDYGVNYPTEGGVMINNNNLPFLKDLGGIYELTVVSPYLFFFPLFEKLMRANGLYLRTNELAANSDMMSLLLYNNVDINKGETGTTTASIVYITNNGTKTLFVVDKVAGISRSITTFNYSKLMPAVSIKDIILGIQNMLNVALVPNGDDTYSIIDREARLLGTAQDIDRYFNGVWELGEKKDVSLKFNMKHDEADAMFGEKYVDLSDRIADFRENDFLDEDMMKSFSGDFLGQLCRVLSTCKIFEWTCTVTTTEDFGYEEQVFAWVFISVDYQPGFVNYGKEKTIETIETAFSTLAEQTAVPFTQQLGRTNLRKASEAPFTPRLLFYTNLRTCANHTANYNLNFTGDNNLIDTRWKYFAPWWAKRQAVTGYASLPENFLKTFDINRKLSTREGQVMPMRTITRISHRGVEQTKIEGFKVE